MPTISEFFGIVIRMYYEDHAPPHFHAYYAEFSASVTIDTLELKEGHLPNRAFRMVLEWAFRYRSELMQNWDLARDHRPMARIPPLK